MASSRTMILLMAVCFQCASCARLKRSKTHRTLAHVALAAGGRPEVEATGQSTSIEGDEGQAIIVSQALMDEKDKIHMFITEEELRKKQYELDRAATHADLEHYRWRLENDRKLYKFWHWRMVSDHLKNIENEIVRLESREHELSDLIIAANDMIDNLKDAKQWALDAAGRAQRHESHIESLHNQLETVKQEHVDTVEAYAVAEKQAKEAGDEKLRILEAELAAMTEVISKQRTELKLLNNGTHDLHVGMQKTQKNMQETIAQHEENIKNFTAQILDNDRETREAENARVQSKDKYEVTLAKLRADRKALVQEAATETAQLATAKKVLLSKTQEGNAAIEELERHLQQQVDGLSIDIGGRITAIEDLKTENAAKLLALKAKFNEEAERITRQINAFIAAKQEAVDELKALRKEHVEVSDGDVASEALHQARENLESKLELQKDAKANAVANSKRIKHEITVKNAELNHESSWWKIWNWDVWSSTKVNIQNALDTLARDLAAEEARKSNCEELISYLTTQIESKLSASQLAEVEEVVINDLEKQIHDKQSEKRKAAEDHQSELALEKQEGDDELHTFENMLRKLKAQQSSAEATLDQLENGTHDKHKDLEDAKVTIRQTIETHDKAIKNLTAAISLSKNTEDELDEAEKNDVADHEQLIASLKVEKEQLAAHQHDAEGYKKAAEDTLAGLKADHNKSIENLKGSIASTIEDLEQSKVDQKKDFEAEKREKDQMLQLEKMKQFKDLDNLKGQIEELKASKVEASDLLHQTFEDYKSK